MLPFFLNVIINPQKYCRENNIPLKDIQCSKNYYLGLSISDFLFVVFCHVMYGII